MHSNEAANDGLPEVDGGACVGASDGGKMGSKALGCIFLVSVSLGLTCAVFCGMQPASGELADRVGTLRKQYLPASLDSN